MSRLVVWQRRLAAVRYGWIPEPGRLWCLGGIEQGEQGAITRAVRCVEGRGERQRSAISGKKAAVSSQLSATAGKPVPSAVSGQ